MKQLRNIYSKEECLKRVAAEPFKRKTISFYKYVKLDNVQEFRDKLYILWSGLDVLGRIYLSEEGINAQLSVPEHKVKAFRMIVDMIPAFKNVPFKLALEEPDISFWKLTIKVRKHILAHGIENLDMTTAEVGPHLSAEEYNEAIENGAIIVDMRNGYESEIGHFEGAITPEVNTFREELPKVLDELKGKEDDKILLYCTGGIRCEPTSAWLKQKGFKDVNQLHGGIIQYAEDVKKKKLDTKYIGKNFVFDGRTAEAVTDDVLGTCHNCKEPANTHVDCPNEVCHALFIQCKDCQKKMNKCCSDACIEIMQMPEEERRAYRKGKKSKFLINQPV